MNIKSPETKDIPGLHRLWKQAFGDSDAFISHFFSTAFSPSRARCLYVENQPVSVIYWFDCDYMGASVAYLYAIATDKAFQRRGFFKKLMENTLKHLENCGYAGAVLVPADYTLFPFYEKAGYASFGGIRNISATAGNIACAYWEITPEEFLSLEKTHCPVSGVFHRDTTLQFYAQSCKFYRGEDWILAAEKKDGILMGHLFWGDPQRIPEILFALNCQSGKFLSPSGNEKYAMCHLFAPEFPLPDYFGISLA